MKTIPFLAVALAAATLSLTPLKAETPPAAETWLTGDTFSGEWAGLRTRLQDRGIEFSASYTAEVWSNTSGGMARGSVYTGLIDFGLDLDLKKLVGWEGATLHNSWFAPHGRDLSGEKVGNLFTVSNAAAYNSLYLFQLWLQQDLWDQRVSLRVGQLAADEEFAGSDYGGLFINAAFGWPPFLSENLTHVGPAFPKGTLGVRLALTPLENFTFQTALYQGDPFEDTDNNHGTRWALGRRTGWLWMNEAQLRWNHAESATGKPGQLKLGFWHHRLPHPEQEPNRRARWGFYGVIDQMLYPTGDDDAGLGWFARAGAGPQERSSLGFYFDTGFQWKGLIPCRRDDSLGIAFAYGKLSRHEINAMTAEGAINPHHEAVIELTYQCQLTPWCTVQPDLQWVFHPGGSDDFQSAFVVGARATLTF